MHLHKSSPYSLHHHHPLDYSNLSTPTTTATTPFHNLHHIQLPQLPSLPQLSGIFDIIFDLIFFVLSWDLKVEMQYTVY